MKRQYEKHQRDYTILATSLVMEEFFSSRFENYFHSRAQPMYILVRDGVLYHYLDLKEKTERAQYCSKEYSFSEVKNFIKKHDADLKKYRLFIQELPENSLKALKELHRYMTLFTTIIVLCAEVPMYTNLDKHVLKLLVLTRRKYDDVNKIAMDIQRILLNKFAKQAGLEKNILDKMLISEFRKFLKTGELPSDLSKRSKFFLAKHYHSGMKIIKKTEAKEVLKKLETIIPTNTKEIKGQVAYRGHIRGRVKIIRLISEANALKKGEVLVTSMTDPRYLPIMKRAAAIVTDEGGITCHAAIVVRELKKPCVIGTKLATSILKDGDLVEVDAQKGLVKIISKK